MVEPTANFDQLPFDYKIAYFKFLVEFVKATDYDEQESLFDSYQQKYTVLPSILSLWLSKLKAMPNTTQNVTHLLYANQIKLYTEKIIEKLERFIDDSDYDLLSQTFDYPNLSHISHTFQGFPNLFDYEYASICHKLEQLLSLPHQYLQKFMEIYEKWSVNFISLSIRKKYQLACELYIKMKEAKTDHQKWVELLLTVDDDQFICHQFKCRIGEFPVSKDLWKTFMKYLEEKNGYTKLLCTYSRYCRLFVDDAEMREEFHQKLRNFSEKESVKHWWKDLVEIEKSFGTAASAQAVIENANKFKDVSSDMDYYWNEILYKDNDKTQNISDPPEPRIFYSKKIHRQPTCLPSDYLTYFLDNASPALFQRLQMCAKCIFIKKPTPICRNLIFNKNGNINQIVGSSIINYSDGTRNIYVTDMVYSRFNLFLKLDFSLVTWNPSKIILPQNKIKLSELTILVKNSKIDEANFYASSISDGDNDILVEDFISLFPDASILRLPWELKCSPSTNDKLESSIGNAKFSNFYVPIDLALHIDATAFSKFVKNRADNNAKFVLSIRQQDIRNQFKSAFEDCLQTWDSPDTKPKLRFSKR